MISPYQVTLLLMILLTSQVSICQNQKIDSLKSLLPTKAGGEYIDVLFELGRAYGDSDYERSFQYMNEGLELAQQTGDSSRIVKLGRGKGQSLRRLGKLDDAIMLFQQTLSIARRLNNSSEVKTVLNGLGLAYFFQVRYGQALKYLFESLDLRKRGGDKYEIGIALNNIGLVYQSLKDYDRALYYYKQALEITDDSKNRLGSDVLLLNTSLCYAYKNNFIEASKIIERAFALCGGDCSEDFLVDGWKGLGIISLGNGNLVDAETHFLKSYNLADKLGRKRSQLDNINYLVEINIRQNQLKKAEKYLNAGEILAASGVQFNFEISQLYPIFFHYI